MKKEQEIERSNEPFSQVMVQPLDPTKIRIQTKQDTMLSLINRLRHEEIDLNTDFQRDTDIWSNAKMSLLIESILIRFPLPSFYFDATNDNCWKVVDGLQRLATIKKFVIDDNLKLEELEYLFREKDVAGKKYSELPSHYKRRIDEASVTLFLILPGTPIDVKRSIFKRINKRALNA